MAKTYVPTVAMDIASEAIQIHGRYGCIRDFRVELPNGPTTVRGD
ncbi:hypothetical protein JZ786_19675 [Alicyclobacillus mengziensis]|uniref:Acyl-CoA dehydrogenase/oxidase C-terminal domain-containing protein n=1 Tax=Alicyclobacillus mengziensis TaxID=2931921 RepID=A0A9X7W493_9BACL|nr:hypothetical protein JZ786_19675 [Alicyclobacillus mengziensis]